VQCSPSTVKSRAAYLGVTLDDGITGEATRAGKSITTDDAAEWGDIRALLASRGLNIDGENPDWSIQRARVNSWGGEDGNDNAQLRVDLEPTIGLLMPARTAGWVAPNPPPRATVGRPELTVVLSDQHVPRIDARLHQGVLAWLEEHEPDHGIIAGDFLDYGPVSRHRTDPGEANLQTTIDQAWGVLREYREASPRTRWQWLDGNHEDRMRNAVLDQLAALHGLRRADAPPGEYPVLAVPHLLRLDELGIEYHGGQGDYRHAQVQITPSLACRHGWIATKGSGASALKTLTALNYSVIVGHTHRQSIVYKSGNSIDGQPITLLGCETGTLATVDATGMGYAPNPDWQNGFCTVTTWPATEQHPDGTFKVDLATYVANRLMWRDWSIDP
jgi:predicted phosphodiesterase